MSPIFDLQSADGELLELKVDFFDSLRAPLRISRGARHFFC